MKVTLVAAPMLIRRCPLIGLGYIAAYLQKRGHQVAVIDFNAGADVPDADKEQVWGDWSYTHLLAEKNRPLFSSWVDRILSTDPDVVAFSTWITTVTATLILGAELRRRAPGLKIVLGGPQAGFDSDKLIALPEVDAVVDGEGEETLACLVEEYARTGRMTPVPGSTVKLEGAVCAGGPRAEITDLDSLPFPDFSLFDLDGYFMKRTLPASFNRGCVRKCVFCNIYESWKTYRHRGADSLMREFDWQLSRHPDVDHFEIDVAALNLNLKVIDELCERIIASGRRFTWGGSAVFRPDSTRARLMQMARAGCKRLDIGLESASPKILRAMKKGYVVEHAERMLRDCRDAGIEVNLNVIVGFPGETDEDFAMTKDFLRRNRMNIAAIGPPNELWVGNDNYLQRNPTEFDIILAEKGEMWTSKDGRLTHDVRTARTNELKTLVAELRIGIAANDEMARRQMA